MESTSKQMRAVLVLGKFRVTERNDRTVKIALGGSTTMTILLGSDVYDVREGDLLTFYTEVLTHAQSSKPPVQ